MYRNLDRFGEQSAIAPREEWFLPHQAENLSSKKQSKALTIGSQHGSKRYGVNDSSLILSSFCLFLSLAVF